MKVLVVEDSVIYRKSIARTIESLPDVDQVDTASNGAEGVKCFEKGHHDIVTLDIEMPLMNGIEVLKKLKEKSPDVVVVMISSQTKTGASITIDALRMGAQDFILKQQAYGMEMSTKELFLKEVKTKIGLALTSFKKKLSDPIATKTAPLRKKAPANITKRGIDLVLIGISTGGPNALDKLFKSIDHQLNYSIAITQHMPPLFTNQLAKRLNDLSTVTVREAEEGMVLDKNMAVIAPGGKHLHLVKKLDQWICQLNDGPEVKFCKPSVDVMFESALKHLRRGQGLAMIMTGMGDDGKDGCAKLKEFDIPILTQTESSCVVYGMPKAVDEAGLSMMSDTPENLISLAEEFMVKPATWKS